MNARHPPPAPPGATAAWPEAGRTLRLVRRLSAFYLAITAGLLLLLGAGGVWPMAAAARADGLSGLALGSVLLPLAGLLATLPLAAARSRLGESPVARGWNTIPSGWLRSRWMPAWPRHAPPLNPSQSLSRLARRPQGIIVPLLSLAAALASWWLQPGGAGATVHATLLGGVAIVLTFPLLVAERVIDGVRPQRLPEAAGLQSLLFVPVIVIPLGGALEIATGLGAGWARPAMAGLAAFICVIAAELGVRALANWFLPPPSPMEARAAVSSLAALLLQPGRMTSGGVAAPLRVHLGLDFSRSWALRYMRTAFVPVGLLIALIGWGISGVTLLNLDRRGVYERLGAPVAVWQPGAHIGLPWPLGRVRPVEFGIVHAVALTGPADAVAATGAEDTAPASADRLWDGVHPAEVSYVIASVESSGKQSFQSVNVDLKVLYRVGMDDASALRAAYFLTMPEALVQAMAGRLLAGFFAGQTLTDVLGENRETLAAGLRRTLQAELDRLDAGLELMAVVVEAIHPPPAAAEAYHNVQAAEIVANTAIATERGRVQATTAMARQVAADLTNGARGAAADTVGQASVRLRTFTADQQAAAAGGQAFLMERYFANLLTALAKSPLVIVDHRLNGAAAPVIDLRSFGAPTGRPGDDD